jgi:hypothetical protein
MLITQEKTKHINELHFEHQLWIKELKFYKDELVVFNKRLSEVADMYTNEAVIERLEQFLYQFILQDEVADALLFDLNGHEQFLADTAKENINMINHRVFSDHPELRERMDLFVKSYRELRKEYMQYLSAVL